MDTTLNNMLSPATTANGGLSRAQVRMQMALGRKLDTRDPGVVRESAGQLVSELFLKPLLAEMRKFPFGREFATGGRTEAIFGEQLDERVADAVATSTPGLTSRIMQDLQPRSTAAGMARATWPVQIQTQAAQTQGDA